MDPKPSSKIQKTTIADSLKPNNKHNDKISILGCGWLPLAKALVKNEYLVSGSTTL
jgi:hypothetical protein